MTFTTESEALNDEIFFKIQEMELNYLAKRFELFEAVNNKEAVIQEKQDKFEKLQK
jgi:hypothetical protein